MAPKPITSPFLHYHIPNFLPKKQYDQLVSVYQHLQFKEKETDLFHFFQTNQLADFPKMQFFKKELDKVFWSLEPMSTGQVKPEETFYNIFASYYWKNNYLLCHDDVIEDRKYAFSYYLEDFPSGELVLFNKTANKEIKRIKVTKNTLVIFQVSDISYHEVAICYSDGRKAVTGWFNIKGIGKGKEKVIPPFQPSIPTKDVISFPLSKDYTEEEYFQMMDVEYQFNVIKEQEQGPFYSRKISKLTISPLVLFEIPEYKLLSADFYRVREGDYILLNDPVNTIESPNLIDVFVTCLPDEFEREEDSMLIKIIEEDGSLSGIPEIHDSIFIVHRGNKQYYIDRSFKEFKFAHFIFEKQVKTSNKKVKAQKQKILKKESAVKAKPKVQNNKLKPSKTKKIVKKVPKKQKGTANINPKKITKDQPTRKQTTPKRKPNKRGK